MQILLQIHECGTDFMKLFISFGLASPHITDDSGLANTHKKAGCRLLGPVSGQMII